MAQKKKTVKPKKKGSPSSSVKETVKKKTAAVSRKTSVRTKPAPKIKKKIQPEKKRVSAKKTVKGPSTVRKTVINEADAKKERLVSLRKTLIQKKLNILKEAKQEIAKYLSGETRQLVDTALDDGDWAVVDINEDISLRMLSTHRKTIHDIDEAIRKIDEGTYGICEECGEEISEKRLSILPAAVLCIDCKEDRERFEKIGTEEIV